VAHNRITVNQAALVAKATELNVTPAQLQHMIFHP
jgi:hypothetical protein